MRRATGVVILLVLVPVALVLAQAKTKTNVPVAGASAGNPYQEAKSLIRRARGLLKEFVETNPGGEDAYHARMQLAALENIFRTDAPVVPVTLNEAVQWRVVRAEVTDAHTKLTLEIENTSQNEEGKFSSFERYPLTLIADRKVYAMKKMGIKRPAGVEIDPSDRWVLQPTQAIAVDVYFDALDEGAVDGIIKYIDEYRYETPTRFSLMNVNQHPPLED